MAGKEATLPMGQSPSMFTDALAITKLLPALFGETTSKKTSGGSKTEQLMLSQEAVNGLLKSLMEGTSGKQGLAAIAQGQRNVGMYNTTVNQQMINDLLARSTAEVEARRAPKVTTSQPTTELMQQKGLLGSSTGLLGLAGLALGTKKGREILGIDSLLGGSDSIVKASGAPISGVSEVFPITDGAAGITSSALGGLDLGWTDVGGFSSMLGDAGSSFMGDAVGGMASAALDGFGVVDAFGGFGEMLGGMGDVMGGIGDISGGIPYMGAITNLLEGDTTSAITSGIGFALGGPVGGFVGSLVGDLVGGKVICTELYRQGHMPVHIYIADEQFGKSVHPDVRNGYQIWAKYIVRGMKKSPVFTQMIKFFAEPWAYHMAYKMGVEKKDNTFGKVIMNIGMPICKGIGFMMRKFNVKGEVAYG